ncbi:ankyrin repeat-containing domain protein [Xylariaceae sp. FL0804]|nr:ankyrin repeat-containing domain protein [Xylariaceae sp. FL0804]
MTHLSDDSLLNQETALPPLSGSRATPMSMSSSDWPRRRADICDFPTEILLEVANYLSFTDHLRWILVSRRYERCLSRILYLRLLPTRPMPYAGAQRENAANPDAITRNAVVRWAVEHGSIPTLEKVDAIESLERFINCPTTKSTGHCGVGRRCFGLMPLHQAALHGQSHIIGYLLAKGADINAEVAGGLLPVHYAKTGDVVRELVAHGSRLDAPGGVTPLINSLLLDTTPSAVEAFLQLGADPNQVTRNETTAAEMAVIRGNCGALDLLLKAGADVTRPLPRGGFLIYKAIWLATKEYGTEVALKMVRMLLDHGAPPNAGRVSTLDHDSSPCFTPNLFLAVMMPDSADLVQLLLERGADQHRPYAHARGPLYTNGSPIPGFESVFSDSLVANLVLGTLGSRGPQMGAASTEAGELRMADAIRKITLLVQHGGDVDSEIDGHTLLQLCLHQDTPNAHSYAMAIMPRLVALGADPSRLGLDGDRPIHALIRFFIPYSTWASFPRIVRAGRSGSFPAFLLSFMDSLFARGADPNAPDADSRTPLMLLCRLRHELPLAPLIKYLLHRGVDVNAVDKWGWTALHHAIHTIGTAEPESCEEPRYRLQILLHHSHGQLDLNVLDKLGRAPLHLLLEPERRDPGFFRNSWLEAPRREARKRALLMLIRAGVNVHTRALPPTTTTTTTSTPTTDQQPPGRAAGKESQHPPDYLSWVADTFYPPGTTTTHLPTSFPSGPGAGDTPLHLACQVGDPDLVDVLLRHGCCGAADGDVNATSRDARLTPLMMVAGLAAARKVSRMAMDRTVRRLVAGGADPARRDARGRTAIDIFFARARADRRVCVWAWAPSLEPLLLLAGKGEGDDDGDNDMMMMMIPPGGERAKMNFNLC